MGKIRNEIQVILLLTFPSLYLEWKSMGPSGGRVLSSSINLQEKKLIKLFHPRLLIFTALVLFLSIIPVKVNSQTFHISGNVSTGSTPVSYASVTFINENDTTKKYSTVTDTYGNYQIDIVTSVKEEPVIPQSIELAQNYPNPFISETEIPYKLNQQSDVSIKIYDILGQEVRTFRIGLQPNGIYGVRWDGRNNFGQKVTPGIYFYQLQTNNETLVKKMIFGMGSLITNIPVSKGSLAVEKKKENNLYAEDGLYKIRIENTLPCTIPLIMPKEYNNVIIQISTTLDFIVEESAASPPAPVYPAPYGWVVWHPDGRIAFNWTKILKIDRCIGGVNPEDIDWDSTGFWMINPDGTGLQKLLPYSLNGPPSWSPDGEWIAFSGFQAGYQIFKMKFIGTGFDTTTLTELTFDGGNFSPVWSPNGEWIAYENTNLPSPGIWVMKTDRTQRRFIHGGAYPSWSPTSNFIIFTGFHNEIYRVNISDTSDVVRLTSLNQDNIYATDNRYPKCSPDGTKILFSSQISGDAPHLWLMNADGTNLLELTNFGAGAGTWSSDGSQIVYVQHDWRKADVNNGTLWIMNAAGSNKRQLTYNYDLEFFP
jgi:Tol biopolymer transport system component